MSARFRVRTSSGQELSFASEDIFAEFVRSGDLAPDDVVYDAETREWASALTHPVVLQIQTAAEDEVAAEESVAAEDEVDGGESVGESETAAGADAEGATAEESSPDTPRDESDPGDGAAATSDLEGADRPPSLDIGLQLAPVPEGLSPEQEAAAFVAKMEAERATELDPAEEHEPLSFRMEKGSSNVMDVAPAPTLEPPPPPRAPRDRAPEPRWESESRWESEPPRERSAPEPPRVKKKKQGSSAVWKYAPFVILLAALGVGGVLFGPELFEGARAGRAPDAQEPAPPPPPPPLIPDREDAVRARARELFLTATQTALRGLDAIPEMWLRGEYLAAPSEYPGVRTVWEEYLTTIRQVRSEDPERYRAAYERALGDAQAVDSLRAGRLAIASSDFSAGGGARMDHYGRVEALALAAIQGHDALVQAEGTIAYQPATGPAVSQDPVIEAVGRGPEAQALLEQVLDLILERVHGPGGPGEIANVREWVWVGILDAVAS